MKSYKVFFPPRERRLDIGFPPRLHEAKVFLSTLAFKLHLGGLRSGLLAGQRGKMPALEKDISGRRGILHGERMGRPGIESHARGTDGLLHGGRFHGTMEKEAAGGSGLLHGERLEARTETSAFGAGTGLLHGAAAAMPETEKDVRPVSGTLTGAWLAEWKEVRSSVPSGALAGADLGADIESPAAAVGGLLVGGALRGGSRVVRLRPLSDLDAKGALSQIDGQTLGELDYMIVEE